MKKAAQIQDTSGKAGGRAGGRDRSLGATDRVFCVWEAKQVDKKRYRKKCNYAIRPCQTLCNSDDAEIFRDGGGRHTVDTDAGGGAGGE